MTTHFSPIIERFSRTMRRWHLCGWVALAPALSGCIAPNGTPGPGDLQPNAGSRRAVVLLRVVTEVDGQASPAFARMASDDCVWLGLGDFFSGGKLKRAPLRFLSRETRLDGWTYLVLEPGDYYLAPHPPRFEAALTYDNSWAKLPPLWHLEVPRNAPVIYAGTLFLPGEGRWMLLGPRSLVRFDEKRFEIRNESLLAEVVRQKWLKDLGTLTLRLVGLHSPTEPLILETPPGD